MKKLIIPSAGESKEKPQVSESISGNAKQDRTLESSLAAFYKVKYLGNITQHSYY